MTEPRRLRRLTERQRQILTFIRQHIDGTGYPPSVREIADYVGLVSTSSAHWQLTQLQRFGYIRVHGGRTRAITLLDADGNDDQDVAPTPGQCLLCGGRGGWWSGDFREKCIRCDGGGWDPERDSRWFIEHVLPAQRGSAS